MAAFTLPANFSSMSIDASGRVLLQPAQPGVTIPTVTTLTNLPAMPANWITAAGIAAGALVPGVWDASTTGHTTAGTFGGSLSTAAAGAGGIVTGYAVGQDPATYVLATAANKLATDASGRVILQPVQTGVTIPTVTTVTNAVVLPGIPANWITAAGISAGALNGKGDWLNATSTVAAVWDSSTTGHTTAGTFGGELAAAGGAGDPWSTMLPGSYIAGQAGYIVGNNLNAAITSRMATFTLPANFAAMSIDVSGRVLLQPTQTGVTIPTVTTLTNLPAIPNNWITAAGIAAGALVPGVWDASTTGHTTAGTFGGSLNAASSAGDPWATALPGAYGAGTAGNILGNRLDVLVSSRMATFTLPPNFAALAITAGGAVTVGTLPAIPANWITSAGIAAGALNGKGDWLLPSGTLATVTNLTNLPPIPAAWITAAGIASGAFIAAVWDGSTIGHTAAGTFGGSLNAAGSAGDPWATNLPGSYGAGTAGNILGNRLDVAVSTRSTYAGGAVSSVTNPVTVGTNNDKSGYALAAAGLDPVVIETGMNARQSLAIIGSATAGKSSGVQAGNPIYQAMNGTTTRISATASNGDRSVVTLTPPP
jgi:hypothetical protein